jgi:hypothetical protein
MRFLLPGPIPFSVLESPEDLDVLDLECNQLTGPIPVEFGNYSDLVYLLLSGNKLTGKKCTPLSHFLSISV